MNLEMLGYKIREIRKSKRPKMTGEQLAELSDLSLVTIYNLEAGKIDDVKLDTIERVARALEIPVGELLSEEQKPVQLVLNHDIEEIKKLLVEADKTGEGDRVRERVVEYVSMLVRDAKKKESPGSESASEGDTRRGGQRRSGLRGSGGR